MRNKLKKGEPPYPLSGGARRGAHKKTTDTRADLRLKKANFRIVRLQTANSRSERGNYGLKGSIQRGLIYGMDGRTS